MRRTIIDTTAIRELTDKVVSHQTCYQGCKRRPQHAFQQASVVVGDGNGHVGVGLGKSS